MFIEQILPRAREQLTTIPARALVTDAAEMMLTEDADLLVVCNDGVMAGVLTKTDIVAQVQRHRLGYGFQVPVTAVMTRDVTSCRPKDRLHEVWATMKARGIRRIPVVDAADRPIGVVTMRDALQGLWDQAETEDEFLRDYIAGAGYR
jgi:CBS domain-containing protein